MPHWQELEKEGRVELVAVCDVIEERAKSVAESFGISKFYTDYEEMLRKESFDIIDVCTQNRLHCPVTLAALEAGSNVLVEKPMATNVAEVERMIETAKARNRKLMTAQHFRFMKPHEELKATVESGKLGQIYTARVSMLRRRHIPGWGKFHIVSESTGGPVIDIGVHLIDLALWLMDFPKPVSVSGQAYRMFGDREDLVSGEWACNYPRPEFDVEDYANAYVRFENDVTMSLEVSWAANIPEIFEQLSILGDKAGISANPPGIYGYTKEALTDTRFSWLPEQNPDRAEIRHFTECVEKGLPVRVKPEESLIVQKIVNAIYESSEKKMEIKI